jgi:hypothetical protein
MVELVDTPVIMALLVHQALIRALLARPPQWAQCQGHLEWADPWDHLDIWGLECISKVIWDLLVIPCHINKCTGQVIRVCLLQTEALVAITCDFTLSLPRTD